MLITIFTPAYNRADLLTRVYESLCRQTCMDFEWIVVDDGSTDNTRSLCESWMHSENLEVREDGFEGYFKDTPWMKFRYIYKKNGGKHTAINRGVKEAKGELFFILDSDDYLPVDALQIVADEYNKIKGDKSYAGIAGLDKFVDGRVVGNGLSCNYIDCNAMDIRYKYHVTGDMKEVFRTEVLKEFPFPEIEGERFCPEQLVWFRIAQKYKLHYFNKPIYIAEYQEGGITSEITKARMNSPIASMMCYSELSRYDIPVAQKVKAAINYWRFRFCAKKGTEKPRINTWWIIILPIAWLMHKKDKKFVK